MEDYYRTSVEDDNEALRLIGDIERKEKEFQENEDNWSYEQFNSNQQSEGPNYSKEEIAHEHSNENYGFDARL